MRRTPEDYKDYTNAGGFLLCFVTARGERNLESHTKVSPKTLCEAEDGLPTQTVNKLYIVDIIDTYSMFFASYFKKKRLPPHRRHPPHLRRTAKSGTNDSL